MIKADEDFLNLAAFHKAALARLDVVASASSQLNGALHTADENLLELGHAVASLAEQEQRGVVAGASVATARKADDEAHTALKTLSSAGVRPTPSSATTADSAATSAPVVSGDSEAAAAFAAHQAASKKGPGGIAGMFDTDFDGTYSRL